MFYTNDTYIFFYKYMKLAGRIICDRACENRACGLKYTMSFDERYLITEIKYLDSVSSVVKPNKLLTHLKIFVAIPYWNKKL